MTAVSGERAVSSALLAFAAVALTAPAHAEECAAPDAVVGALERAVVAGRLDAAAALVEQVEASFGCTTGIASPATLGRFYRAQAAWLSLSGASEEATLAWRSAQAVEPGGWTPVLGDALRAESDAAIAAPTASGTGTIRIVPEPAGFRTALDGRERPFPVNVPPGLYVVQVLDPGDGGARFAEQVLILDPGETLRIDIGPLTPAAPSPPPPEPVAQSAPAPLPPAPEPAARPGRWPLWAGIGAGLLAGGSAAMARLQRDDLETAGSLDGLDQAYATQKAWAWSAYGLGSVALVGVGVGVTR